MRSLEADNGMHPVTQPRRDHAVAFSKLEYRDGAIWGNPYMRILRSQLEKYIAEELGEDYLARAKSQTELRRIKKEMSDLKKKLKALEGRKAYLEDSLKK